MRSHQLSVAPARVRRGSALILVLIMTLSLAGLAMSAIFLSSSAGLLARYYDRETSYRYAAEAAIGLGKSRVQRGDTTLQLLDTGAKLLLSAASLKDANNTTIPRILVNLYGANTGDTVGIYGQFITLLSQAYDSGGTRMVRRLDLTAESFSRFAMFTNTFSGGLAYGNGEFIRGRAHSNQGWNSANSPGPTYYDTVTAAGTISGTATYTYPPVSNVSVIPMPTVAKLAALPGYAARANLQFTPDTSTSASASKTQTTGGTTVTLSGQSGGGNPVRGTRVSFRPVDVNGNGKYEQSEGFMMVFDLADGMDTSSLRVDLGEIGPTPTSNIVLMNQCGLLMHFPAGRVVNPGPTFAAAHNEFFPVARFREPWVRKRIIALGVGTAVGNTAIPQADTTVMATTPGADSLPPLVVVDTVLSYGIGNSRCFPAGSPLLMLTERNTTSWCAITQATGVIVYGWGGTGGGCGATNQYGGMDTTFTPNPMRCAYMQGNLANGECGGTSGTVGQVALGSWRTWAGAALPAIPTSVIQANEKPYLWPLFLPYNMNSKGVINSTTGPVYLSDTLRGFITFYESDTTKDIIIIDRLVYDQDPTQSAALCRNFLGIIAGRHVLAANNGLQRPRYDAAGTVRWFGFPNFTLHAVTLALNGTVGIEDGYNYPTTSPGGPVTSPATECGTGNTTSGGCINQTGGVIEQYISPTFLSSGNTGYRENRTVDPCQKTNQRPPFFPTTGRFLDNKYYEIDPTLVATPTQVALFFASLRGRSVP